MIYNLVKQKIKEKIVINIDTLAIELVNKIHFPILDKAMILFTSLGNSGIIWILIGIILILRKKTRKLGIIYLTALFITAVLGEGILKNVVKRERPFEAIEGLRLLVKAPKSYSFPSGHTASSFAAFGVLYFMNSQYKWYGLVLALFISISRVYLNVHYLTDIIGGALLGLVVAYVVCGLFKRKQWLVDEKAA